MRRIGGPPNAVFVRTGVMHRATEPPVKKLVLRRRFLHLFRMMSNLQGLSTLVQFLSVHVRMRPHRASFQRSIDTQRQVPRVHIIFRIHRGYHHTGKSTLGSPKSSSAVLNSTYPKKNRKTDPPQCSLETTGTLLAVPLIATQSTGSLQPPTGTPTI